MNTNHDPKTGKFTKKYKPTKVDNLEKVLCLICIPIYIILILFLYFYL